MRYVEKPKVRRQAVGVKVTNVKSFRCSSGPQSYVVTVDDGHHFFDVKVGQHIIINPESGCSYVYNPDTIKEQLVEDIDYTVCPLDETMEDRYAR